MLLVQAVAANGKTCKASSNGVSMDVSPPELDFYFYLDASQTGIKSEAPTRYQSSKSTIHVVWTFLDLESEIQVVELRTVIVGVFYCKKNLPLTLVESF